MEEGDAFSGARNGLLRAVDEMEQRLRGLLDAGSDLAEEIHELRKLGKRLRGAMMIAREDKALIRRLAVTGRVLGDSRDATVRAETWRRLAPEAVEDGSVEAAIGALVAHQAAAAALRPPAEVVEWSIAALVALRERLEAESATELGQRCRQGAERMLRRLRKRLKRAAGEAEDRDFHEARKSVKAWLGGVRLLAPGIGLPVERQLDELGDRLGEEHDLDEFGEWLLDHGFSPATAPRVWKRLPKLQSRARRRSLRVIRNEVLAALKGPALV